MPLLDDMTMFFDVFIFAIQRKNTGGDADFQLARQQNRDAKVARERRKRAEKRKREREAARAAKGKKTAAPMAAPMLGRGSTPLDLLIGKALQRRASTIKGAVEATDDEFDDD